MPEAYIQIKGWQKEKRGWKELDGRLILSSFSPLSVRSISGLWETVCKFHRLPHAEVTFRNKGESGEWMSGRKRERGRSALWCAASTEEQAVLCPSPTLRHEGERNEWMKRKVWRGWMQISAPYFMNGSRCQSSPSTGPAVQVLWKKPCPAGPIMSVLVQFSSVPASWFCSNSDSMWLCICMCERDKAYVWPRECMNVLLPVSPPLACISEPTLEACFSRAIPLSQRPPIFSPPSCFSLPLSFISLPFFFPRSLMVTPSPLSLLTSPSSLPSCIISLFFFFFSFSLSLFLTAVCCRLER